jgi:hypothetical protein
MLRERQNPSRNAGQSIRKRRSTQAFGCGAVSPHEFSATNTAGKPARYTSILHHPAQPDYFIASASCSSV